MYYKSRRSKTGKIKKYVDLVGLIHENKCLFKLLLLQIEYFNVFCFSNFSYSIGFVPHDLQYS